MADKKEDAEIILEDDGVVTVDLDTPDPVKDKEEIEIEATPEPKEAKKPVPRVRLNEQEVVKQPAAEEAAKVLLDTQRQVEAANATAAAERTRREAAERVALQARQDADEARTVTESTQLTLIANGIEAATRETASLETQLATAFEAGDFKGAAAIQTKLGKATASLDRLENQKAEYEAGAKRTPTTEGRVEAPAQVNSAFENYVSNFAPEAQTWLRAHPECVPANVGGKATANAKMMEGHYKALSQNITPNTPDYFKVIEESTGHRQPVSKAAEVVEAGSDEVEEAPAKPAPKAKKPQTSAPPSRDVPTAQGKLGGQRTVNLTKEQQEMAKISFPHLPVRDAFAQYAKNFVELEAEGKIGRLTH